MLDPFGLEVHCFVISIDLSANVSLKHVLQQTLRPLQAFQIPHGLLLHGVSPVMCPPAPPLLWEGAPQGTPTGSSPANASALFVV